MCISKWITRVSPGALVPLWLVCSTAVAQDRYTLGIGVQEYWDSNFARSANVDSERYTVAVLSLATNQRFSKQDLALSLRCNSYAYDQRDDLDADFYEGQASWRSDWSARLKTALSWNRDAYPVDQLEFSGKDVVALDSAKGQVTLDVGSNISVGAGAARSKQSHSTSLRKSLEFDEDEVFAEISYHTSNKSSLTARLRDGERIYPFPDPINPRELDFDYQQRELEAIWASSAKTRLTATVGQFERTGEINEGVGTQALLDATWDVGRKLSFTVGYTHSEPAQGETSDSPTDVRGGHIKLAWEPGTKWLINMEARHTEMDYDASELEPARVEKIIAFTPLSMTYRFSELLTFRIDCQWVDRQSPVLYRDYDYALANAGLGFKF